MPVLDPRSTALVLIDLQNGIVARPWHPRGGAEVVARAKPAAQRFRDAGATVVLVNVGFSSDYADVPNRNVDEPASYPEGGLPEDWSRLADGLAAPSDLCVTKRQWGAFHGTELDLQLRRRGIRTVALAGIATNLGVESTARQAWELGYDLIMLEDLCAGPSAELHEMAFKHIFPRIARVGSSAKIAFRAG